MGTNIRFIEKPNKRTAEKFIKNKKFSWNSGMFLFKNSFFLEEVKDYSNDIYNLCKRSLDNKRYDPSISKIE